MVTKLVGAKVTLILLDKLYLFIKKLIEGRKIEMKIEM